MALRLSMYLARAALVATSAAVAAGCAGETGETGEVAAPVDPSCGLRGEPVSAGKLVKVFRANGLTMDVSRRWCEGGVGSTDPAATSYGPSALDADEVVRREQGDVLCYVDFDSIGWTVEVVKYPTDTETYIAFLNVNCSVYPSSSEREAEQVNQVEAAARAVVRATPMTG